ncbi:MAG: hypothetical protein AB1641_03715 [Thermodesulfobacteriota bacterium]
MSIAEQAKYLVENRARVLGCYQGAGEEDPARTWDFLLLYLPELPQVMTPEEFAYTVPLMAALDEELTRERKPDGPRRVEGWTVYRSKSDQKYRLYKKIQGRLYTLYLGAFYDRERALNRIERWRHRGLS